jgi:cell division protein ZapA (FtsZ GTPase activity inhibitor)
LQGVVVKPALAIPFFTGVIAFIGNIFVLTNSIQKWQDAIVNRVLEEINPVLNRIKPSLLDALTTIIDQIDAADVQIRMAREQLSAVTQSIDLSPLACMSNITVLREVKQKLMKLKASIESNDIAGVVSTLREVKDDASSAVRAAQSAGQYPDFASGGQAVEKGLSAIKDQVSAEATSLQDKAQTSFRKLNESEMVLLLRSLWTSIRLVAFAASATQSNCTYGAHK